MGYDQRRSEKWQLLGHGHPSLHPPPPPPSPPPSHPRCRHPHMNPILLVSLNDLNQRRLRTTTTEPRTT